MKLLSLIIFGLVSVSLQQDTIGDGNQCVESCKDGEQEGLGDHCYYWSTARKSWDQSESDCKTRGGHLAAVTSLEIHNFLLKEVDKDDRDTWFWIGGSDKEQEGNWEWVDGSVWDFTIWADQPHQQQPEGGVNHGCLQIYNHHYAQNGWNDHRCDYYYPFICSWRICQDTTEEVVPGTTSEPPSTNGTIAGDDIFDIMGGEGLGLGFGIILALILIAFFLVKVFQKLQSFKNDYNVARAPKTDENHYYGIYYRSDGSKIDNSVMEVEDVNTDYE